MDEGWINEEYVVLFGEETSSLNEAYAAGEFLPSYTLVGLLSWNDFIVADSNGRLFTVPTVPLVNTLVRPFELELAQNQFIFDERVHGRIKWYVTPLVFGGDPQLEENIAWLKLDQHVQLVKWWNEKYRELQAGDYGAR